MNFQQVAIIQAPEIQTNFNNKTDIHKREKSICLGIKLEWINFKSKWSKNKTQT